MKTCAGALAFMPLLKLKNYKGNETLKLYTYNMIFTSLSNEKTKKENQCDIEYIASMLE